MITLQVEAKTKEIETEKHLKQLAERETGRVQKDTSKLQQEKTELGEKVASLQTQVGVQGSQRGGAGVGTRGVQGVQAWWPSPSPRWPCQGHARAGEGRLINVKG